MLRKLTMFCETSRIDFFNLWEENKQYPKFALPAGVYGDPETCNVPESTSCGKRTVSINYQVQLSSGSRTVWDTESDEILSGYRSHFGKIPVLDSDIVNLEKKRWEFSE